MAVDVVTLSWCLGEIRESLAQTERLLERQLESDSEDLASLRAARAALHQAHGALEVVGIDGVGLITREAENLLDALERGQVPLTGAVASRLARAFRALVEHLEELLHGAPHQPLYLYPYYRELLEARKADRAPAADLFFPDLAARLPASVAEGREVPDGELLAARGAFERGLLALMRASASPAGPALMAKAIDVVGASPLAAGSRAFWWVASAYLDAVAHGLLPVDVEVKRLLARLNLQLRKTLEDRAPVAERLVRDMLFALAGVPDGAPRVAAVRAAFALQGAVPADYAQPRYGRLDERALRAAREALAKARSAFDKVARGSAAELPAFSQSIDAFCDAIGKLPAEGLRALGRALAEVRRSLNQADALPRDALALELAMAILFAEQALEQGARPGSDYDRHGHEMAARLSSALAGRSSADEEMPEWLRSLSRAAQDRMTMATFVTEVGNSLRGVEKTLDAFFRDPADRDGLPECVRTLHQIAGVLRLLGHEEAASGAEAAAARVASFADAAGAPESLTPQAFEQVASSVGAIGFYVEELQHPERAGGRFEFDAQTGEFRAHLTRAGEARDAQAAAGAPSAAAAPQQSAQAHASLETSLEAHAGEAGALFGALASTPTDALLRDRLRDVMVRLSDACVLLELPERRQGALDAIAGLEAGAGLDLPALAAALRRAGVAAEVAPAPAPAVPADQAGVDSELLEIFLSEASEVLDAIAEQVALSRRSPSDLQHLTTIRRGFHTLKGSSRMVGLTDFGEAAWALEQVMNLWLADEREGTDALYALIDAARAQLAEWVRASREAGPQGVRMDCAPLVAAASALRDGAPVAPPAVARAAAAPDAGDAVAAPARLPDDALTIGIPATPGTAESSVESSVEAPQPSPAPQPESFDDTVRIGDRTISRALYMIFLSEADDLVSTLVDDLSAWRAQPARGASGEALRAAHSLAGSAAIVQLDGVHDIARRLEAFMQSQRACAVAPEAGELAVAAHAVERIQAMLHRFAAGSPPGDEAEARDAVDALADAWLGKVGGVLPVDDVPDALDGYDEALLVAAPDDAGLVEEPSGGDAEPFEFDLTPEETFAALSSIEVDEIEAPEGLSFERLDAPVDAISEAAVVTADEAFDAPGRPVDVAAEFASAVGDDAREGVGAAGVADDEAAIDGLSFDADAPADGIVIGGIDVASSAADVPPLGFAPAAADATLEGEQADAAPPLPADELDADLLPVFVEEADDYLPQIGENLRRWQAQPDDRALPQTLMRQLHTVKGSARMAGAMAIGQLVHDIETRIEALGEAGAAPVSQIEELVGDHDRVVALFEAIRQPQAPGESTPARETASAAGAGAPPAATAASETHVAQHEAAPPADDASASPAPQAGTPAASESAPAAEPAPFHDRRAAPRVQPLVRVRADLLDRLVNEAGEVSIARSRLDNELTGLRQALADLTENVARLRGQLREIEIQADTQIQARIAQRKDHEQEFDPLEFDRYTRFQELTRMLAESVNDVATVQHNAMRSIEDASQDLHRQGQVLRDLQQDLMRVRMVQFGSIADRLYRVVRQVGKELDKRVRLDIHGAAVEVDRGVLERMAAPIEHLLRNSLAHGIEPREVRAARGKPETGEIAIEVRQEGREIVLGFADDGGGLDYARIRARAVANGLIDADATPNERELGDLIFMPGFSTATSVTEISGRGVGMDVVRAEVASLGGRIETQSTPGEGTRFTVHLPLTLAVSQVVLISAGRARFAVPSSSVEQVLQLKPQALAAAYAERSVEWQGERVPLFYLGTLVELPDLNPVAQHYSPVVVLRSGHQRIALHCDDVTRNQEVVVKSVGAQAARVRGIAGATVLGNGDIVLIVNPVAFAQVVAGEVLDRVVQAPRISAEMADALPAVVMVVDDSLTVRKVTQRLLAREGYQVLLAKDGVDAMRQLEDIVPDVMLVDIEMPRMDGFDLTRTLRADDRFRHIPIVMISSRTADKHRGYAKSLGVDVFLGKPYAEDELLAHVAAFTTQRPRLASQG